MVIGVGPLLGLLEYLLRVHLSRSYGLPIADLRIGLDLNLITVVLGAIILVLAEAFEVGGRLQREQDLTI